MSDVENVNNMVKTPEQILSIMKAAAIGDMCFSHMLGFLKTGMTEIEAAAEIERVLFSLGAEKLAFPVICVSGERTNQPHGEPTDKVIGEGDFVTLDFGAVIEGYCADMTRTVAMGRVNDFQKKVYNIVFDAQLAALAACKAGVRCFDVDKVARDIIEAAGFGEAFVHGTGHGVGTEVHEAPKLNRESEETLEENMPVTIEPGIYPGLNKNE
jgi:Xaa-Pro aminopeptidase